MDSDAEHLLGDLDRQRERYERMVEATIEQNRRIASSDMDGVLEVLQRKSALLQEIEEIERGTAAVRKRWNEAGEARDPGSLRRVEEAVEKTKGVLQRLLALEEEGRGLMERQKGATAEKLKELHRKKKGLDAYGRSGPSESRFYDTNQ